jgi:hypothetical protein
MALRLQTKPTRSFTGKKSAETVLVLLPMKRQAEKFHRPQSQGETGRFGESSLVLAIDFGMSEGVKEPFVVYFIPIAARRRLHA